MDSETILALYDQEQRIDIEYLDTRRERRPHVVRHISTTGEKHFIAKHGFRQLSRAWACEWG